MAEELGVAQQRRVKGGVGVVGVTEHDIPDSDLKCETEIR